MMTSAVLNFDLYISLSNNNFFLPIQSLKASPMAKNQKIISNNRFKLIFIILNMRKLILSTLLIGIIITLASTQKTQCIQYVGSLIQKLKKNITALPIYSLQFSGISTNNPGQKLECLNVNYSYFLITFKNTTSMINTFTGICIQSKCSQEDIEVALQSLNCKVYQFSKDPQVDTWGTTGYILLIIWVGILVIWSIVSSCRQPDQNQFVMDKKQSEKRESINSEEKSEASNNVQGNKTLKIFNYYEGYKKIFQISSQKNIMSPILFLAVVSFAFSTQFSYRQLIADNATKAPQILKGFFGIFVTNTQIAIYTILFVLGMKLAYGIYKIQKFGQMGRYFFDKVMGKWVLLIIMSLFIYGIMNCIDDPVRKIWLLNYGKDCPTKMWQYWFLVRNLQFDSCVCMPWLWLLETEILLTIISMPFIVFFRVNKMLSYILMGLMVLISLFIGVMVLDSQNIFYQPERLFNNQAQFVANYGGNSLVRAAPFFLGLIFGLMVLEGLEKLQNDQNKIQYKMAKSIRKRAQLQILLQSLGIAGMIGCYLMIGFYLYPSDRLATDDQSKVYTYLVLVPNIFLFSMSCFLLPSFWMSRKYLSPLINKVLGWSHWAHLDKISYSFYLLTPMVIGFTTFNMQSSIYYDFDTLITYLIGDLMIIYILSILATASIENQVITVNNWLEAKIFGNEIKYSVLVIQD